MKENREPLCTERLSEQNTFISELLSVSQAASSKDLMLLTIKGPSGMKLLRQKQEKVSEK